MFCMLTGPLLEFKLNSGVKGSVINFEYFSIDSMTFDELVRASNLEANGYLNQEFTVQASATLNTSERLKPKD